MGKEDRSFFLLFFFFFFFFFIIPEGNIGIFPLIGYVGGFCFWLIVISSAESVLQVFFNLFCSHIQGMW